MPEDNRYQYKLFQCNRHTCNFICYTLNQLQEHMLDKHSVAFVPKYTSNGVYKKKGEENERTQTV